MRKIWKDLFKPGSPERESFDDLDKLLVDTTAVGALQVNFGAADSPVSVSHTLKRVPKFFVLTESVSAIILYATADDRTNWTDKQIVLRSNTISQGVRVCVH
jgi:hypothetical protein